MAYHRSPHNIKSLKQTIELNSPEKAWSIEMSLCAQICNVRDEERDNDKHDSALCEAEVYETLLFQ